jgi:hypothetical protein
VRRSGSVSWMGGGGPQAESRRMKTMIAEVKSTERAGVSFMVAQWLYVCPTFNKN